MYTKRRFSFWGVIKWTKKELIFFFIYSCVITAIFELLDLYWLQVPLAPIGLIGTAVAFMVGFQNNAAYDRIWEARKIWGGIVNASRSLIITVKDSFYMHNVDATQEEKEELKIVTNRHIAWLTALRYAMRAKKIWEATYQGVSKSEFNFHVPEFVEDLGSELKPYLSDQEFNHVMKHDNKPNAIISLQSKHLRELTNQKKLWDFSLLELQGILKDLTALQGKSERIKNFPYPKQYGSLSYHFVHIFMWLLPLGIIPIFHKMGEGEIAAHHDMLGHIFLWLNVPFTVIVTWVFNTMLRIGLAGENPFEGSPNDVPISNIARGISRDILQIIDEDPENIPAPFDNVNDVQM